MTELDDLPSTYPGAADLTRQLDQEKIQLLTERVNSLRKENDELRQKLSIGEKDAHDFVAFFQKEMESKEETMTKLTEDVALKEQKIEEELRFMRASTAKEVADVSAAAIAKEQQLSMQITSVSGAYLWEGIFLYCFIFSFLTYANHLAAKDGAIIARKLS
jgi:hypothetical protein